MLDYAELKSAIRFEVQRAAPLDDATIRRFSNHAGDRINRRLGLELAPLIGDSDSNYVLRDHADLYLFACLEFYHRWVRDWDQADEYDRRWASFADQMNITVDDDEWTSLEGGTPIMKSECEQLVEAESGT